MVNYKRFTDGHVGKRYLKPEVWLPIIFTTMGMVWAASVWTGSVTTTVKAHQERLAHLENNNQELKESSARVDERTKIMQEQQRTMQSDIKTILHELRSVR